VASGQPLTEGVRLAGPEVGEEALGAAEVAECRVENWMGRVPPLDLKKQQN